MRRLYSGVAKHSLSQLATEFSYELASGFWRRLLGLRKPISADALFFPNCRWVHGFALKKKIQLVFISSSGVVLDVHSEFGGYSIRRHAQAAHVLEFSIARRIEPGDHLIFAHEDETQAARGFSMVEVLFALPILIFSLFALIQIGLLWHAKFALQHAVVVAARHASVSHGSDAAIRDSLVRGLMPFVGRSSGVSDLLTASFRAGQELSQGLASGWLRWEVLSPSRQSFQDWGKSADRYLSPTARAGEIEIPSAHLSALATRTFPASGIANYLGGLPVGSLSKQTLLQANTLKLKLTYGVPLNMPLVGPLLAKTLSLWSGCGWPDIASPSKVGLVNYGDGANASLLSSSVECRALAARDLSGRWKPRWTVQVFATVTMQSNARHSLMVLQDAKH